MFSRLSLAPLLLAPLLAGLPSCVVLEIKAGDGVPGTSVRELGSFEGLANESGIDVRVTFGEPQMVSVTCDQNLVSSIFTEIEDNVLVVSIDDTQGHSVELIPETECVVEVVVADMRTVTATGSGNIELSSDEDVGVDAVTATGSGDILLRARTVVPVITVAATGSGEIEIDGVEADDVTLSSSGSGDVRVFEGAAAALSATTSGSGGLLVRGLVGTGARVTLTGSGDAAVTVTQSLRATVTGSGDLTVWGAPSDRDVQSTGSGEVQFAE